MMRPFIICAGLIILVALFVPPAIARTSFFKYVTAVNWQGDAVGTPIRSVTVDAERHWVVLEIYPQISKSVWLISSDEPINLETDKLRYFFWCKGEAEASQPPTFMGDMCAEVEQLSSKLSVSVVYDSTQNQFFRESPFVGFVEVAPVLSFPDPSRHSVYESGKFRYIYVDFPTPTGDGGGYYLVDVNSFIELIETTESNNAGVEQQ